MALKRIEVKQILVSLSNVSHCGSNLCLILYMRTAMSCNVARSAVTVSGHGVRSALPELLPFLNILLFSTSYTYKL